MCGLVLVINKRQNGFTLQQQSIFNTLLYLSGGFRGRDGTGVVSIDNIGNLKLAKAALPVDTFLTTTEMDELERHAFKSGWAMIGHNRSATKGSITDANSHPFWTNDNIVMVHNGTFNGSHKHIKDTEVDSEAICHLLEENESPEDALKKVDAAYALIWYNVGTKSIHLIRNHQRPLWYMELSNSYVFASEECFINFAIEKFKLQPESPPYEIEAYSMNVFTLNNDKTTEFSDQALKCAYTHPPFRHNEFSQTFYKEGPQESIYNAPYYVDMFQKVVAVLKDKIVPTKHSQLKEICAKYDPKVYTPIKVKPFEVVELTDSKYEDDYLIIGRTMDEHQLLVAFKSYLKPLEEVIHMIETEILEVEHTGVVWRREEKLFPVDNNTPLDTWNGIAMIHGYAARPVKLLEHNVH